MGLPDATGMGAGCRGRTSAAVGTAFVFAAVSGSQVTHADLLLFVLGALVASAASWLGGAFAFDRGRVNRQQ